jgi:competence protein ComEA
VAEPGGRRGSQGPLISLSAATATQLQELPGVGPVTAERIIAHREEHGAFRAVDDLAAVWGIGAARIEAIRDLVTP